MPVHIQTSQCLLQIPQTFCCTAGGHDRYKSLRNIFYSDINGVIIVHDHAASRCYSGLITSYISSIFALMILNGTYQPQSLPGLGCSLCGFTHNQFTPEHRCQRQQLFLPHAGCSQANAGRTGTWRHVYSSLSVSNQFLLTQDAAERAAVGE